MRRIRIRICEACRVHSERPMADIMHAAFRLASQPIMISFLIIDPDAELNTISAYRIPSMQSSLDAMLQPCIGEHADRLLRAKLDPHGKDRGGRRAGVIVHLCDEQHLHQIPEAPGKLEAGTRHSHVHLEGFCWHIEIKICSGASHTHVRCLQISLREYEACPTV
ncbi:hypothetical protein K458DRAFT_141858 [Lentithecium fluviatile CBS 122367]|uniref:Uncharacterized protein n=1 Tax=Lentithecium fluviatile CBS 122367 TaxID=1168545 RepID=A0A6G1IIU5_9PLEO|nr:hypothetical protein K458DRAFT_141858 [Lentithecium fluviatile CBS 122367]